MLPSMPYRSATLEQAIQALDNTTLLKQIFELASKHHCQISLAYPRKAEEATQIHFILKPTLSEQPVSLDAKISLSGFIADNLQYDAVEVYRITCDDATFHRLYQDDVTPITLDNYDQIHTFFIKNYPQAYLVPQDTKRAKRKRASSTLFESEGSSQTDTTVHPIFEQIIAFLQQDPALWAAITQEPHVLEEVVQHIREGFPQTTISDSTIKQ